MLNFIEYNKNKLNELVAQTVEPAETSDKFGSWRNLIKKVSEYKSKIGTPRTVANGVTEQPTVVGGVILKVNVGFIIESHRGHKYDFTYATTGKRQTDVPLYYVKSDDENIKNESDNIFIEDKDINNVKSIFGVLKNWSQKTSPTPTPTPTSPTPEQQNPPVQNNENRTFSSLLEEIDNTVSTPAPVENLNNYYMIQIGDPNGKFKTYKEFNEINYTVNKLLFGENSKYKLQNMKYSDFMNMESKFQHMSKKSELYPTWYLEKKLKVQGEEDFYPIKFDKQIGVGNILNIHKNNTESEEVKIKVSKITAKK